MYTEFSTHNADYVLQLERHDRENNNDVNLFNGCEGIVLETAYNSLDACITWRNKNQRKIIDYAEERKIPIFGADVGLTDFGEKRFGFDILNASVFLLYFHESSPKICPELLRRIYSPCSLLIQSPIVAARDAINARKIEEFLAPYLSKKNGKRPKIGMAYGAGHLGIQEHLKHKLIRNVTLFNWKYLNFCPWAGIDTEKLDIVEEASFKDNLWHYQIHKTKLFALKD